MSHPPLTLLALQQEAIAYSQRISGQSIKSLYGVTDGKAVGTFVELDFRNSLQGRYAFTAGNAAKGIDFPELSLDVKVTSLRQPQSSCPFRSARQKIYGLGYSLLVFVYDKKDLPDELAASLQIKHLIFVDAASTADHQTTTGLRKLIENGANRDDLLAFFAERMLPVDEIEAEKLADEALLNPPQAGYLTISNALQWRLQYSRVIEKAGEVQGLIRLL